MGGRGGARSTGKKRKAAMRNGSKIDQDSGPPSGASGQPNAQREPERRKETGDKLGGTENVGLKRKHSEELLSKTSASQSQTAKASHLGPKKRKRGQPTQEAVVGNPAKVSKNDVSNSRVSRGDFSLRSSLGSKFVLMSSLSFVEEMPIPSSSDWQDVVRICGLLVDHWESRGSVVLADFEGEFTGFEGELSTAAFMRTSAIDPKGLGPLSGESSVGETGILVDMRCPEGVLVVKRIMESARIIKAVWGADSDITSLMHAPAANPLSISSSSLVDVQLGFCTPSKRLSMSKMLQRVPPKRIERLPSKASAVDFVSKQALNQRAIPFPLVRSAAVYAVDDLHRLDIVLRCQRPPAGNYMEARHHSEAFVCRLRSIPGSVAADKLQHYTHMLEHRKGLEKQAVAVKIKRHCLAVALRGFGECLAEFQELREKADELLHKAGVTLADDLSFAD